MYRLTKNAPEKTSRRKREREFFETQKATSALVYNGLLTTEIVEPILSMARVTLPVVRSVARALFIHVGC